MLVLVLVPVQVLVVLNTQNRTRQLDVRLTAHNRTSAARRAPSLRPRLPQHNLLGAL